MTITTPNGCIAVDSVEIKIENLKLSPAANPSAICQNTPVNLYSGAKNGNCHVYTVGSIPYGLTAGTGTSLTMGDDQVSSALPKDSILSFFAIPIAASISHPMAG